MLFLTTPKEVFSPVSGGAVATVVEVVARHMAQDGHEVVVASRRDDNEVYDSVPFASLGEIPWPRTGPERARWALSHNRFRGSHWPAYQRYLSALRRHIRSYDNPPEVVVAHNDAFVTRHLRRWLPDATVVVWIHNDLGPRSIRALEQHRPDHIVTVSDYIRSRTIRSEVIDLSTVTVLHNGVDVDAFRPRDGFDVPVRPCRVLLLGRLDKSKGADVAVTALRDLRQEGVDLEFTVAGSPWFYDVPGSELSAWTRSFLADVEAGGGTYLPHVPRSEVPSLIRSHDIGCVLSRWNDPFPLTVLELMASGCAVMASAKGGIPEATGDAAEIVDPEDLSAVTGALRRLATDTDHLVMQKRRALAHARESGWEVTAAQFTDLITGSRQVGGTRSHSGPR